MFRHLDGVILVESFFSHRIGSLGRFYLSIQLVFLVHQLLVLRFGLCEGISKPANELGQFFFMRQLAFDFLPADRANVAHMQFLAQRLGKLVDSVALFVEQCLTVVHDYLGIVDQWFHCSRCFLFLFNLGKRGFERGGGGGSALFFFVIRINSLVCGGDVSLQVLGCVAFFAQFGQMELGKRCFLLLQRCFLCFIGSLCFVDIFLCLIGSRL